ncbi:hypothetical protein [Methylobacterium longum]|uniref:Uncharacterized protein n=1 Tax=Methylobacterium longum TaxID=767694 RepID=A0ABT8ANF6_9HYPH|nr:hypothetical protein [Methylobacterium longum]MDN3571353.1 hypothetical protein [Methylobacterium longum]GJE09211.1 hypothetical protein FOHLNKBM_0233 [Methylobacterium longum]
MRLRIGVALAVVIIAAAALLAGPLSRGERLSDILTGRTPLLAGGAPAPAGGTDLSGTASLGMDQRPATLHVACDPAGIGLSAALIVPRYAELAPRFDFAGLDGTGGAAPLTGILVSSAGSVRSVRMPVQGVPTGPDSGFTLTVTGSRRGEDPLRGVARSLTQPGTKIIWTQASPRTGDPTLTATFPIAESEAAALKAALGGCLTAPF